MSWKDRFRRTLRARLIIIGSIFALVGWFLLFTLLAGSFLEKELTAMERLLQTPAILWVFRGTITVYTILLVWQYKRVERLWEKPAFRFSMFHFFAIGAMGWVAGLIYLTI